MIEAYPGELPNSLDAVDREFQEWLEGKPFPGLPPAKQLAVIGLKDPPPGKYYDAQIVELVPIEGGALCIIEIWCHLDSGEFKRHLVRFVFMQPMRIGDRVCVEVFEKGAMHAELTHPASVASKPAASRFMGSILGDTSH